MLGIVMFAAAVAMLLIGFPVAFSFGGVAVLFALLGSDLLSVVAGIDLPWEPAFRAARLNILPQRIYGFMSNYNLVAVPFFVFMGVMLEKSGLAEDLLETMGMLFGSLRGGLALSVVAVGALLAASTGVVGASVVTMGVLALPIMLKYNYSKPLATGVIASSGTLGQIIPPSIVLVILGDQIGVSIGPLFLGAFVPGLMLAGLFMLWVVFVALTRPEEAPAMPPEARTKRGWALGRAVLLNLVPPFLLIFAVLGSIFFGVATPTEAGAVGAFFATLLAVVRTGPLFAWLGLVAAALALSAFFPVDIVWVAVFVLGLAVLLFGFRSPRFGFGDLLAVMDQTVKLTSMVFIILVGATAFSLVFTALHGDRVVQDFLTGLPGGSAGFLFFSMLVVFLLGFFIDFIEITFIVVPLLAPIARQMFGDDMMVWFGVLIAMNLQASFLTPPFGFALFYLRGVAPPGVETHHIYRGVIPFIFIQLIAVLLIAFFPSIVNWLPSISAAK